MMNFFLRFFVSRRMKRAQREYDAAVKELDEKTGFRIGWEADSSWFPIKPPSNDETGRWN